MTVFLDPTPARLAALDGYGILDTPAEAGFDDIVHLASEICGTPVALVSLVADDRQWFKARVGFDACETPIDQSVCAHALSHPGLLVIPDLTLDPRTEHNALVTGPPHIRFYAGARLATAEGVGLGTLCVIDSAPRPGGLTPRQAGSLERLARQVMSQLELRRALVERDAAAQRIRDADTRHRQILDSAVDYAIVTLALDGTVTGWSTGAAAILGWSEAEMRDRPADIVFTAEDVAAGIPEAEMATARERGRSGDERWHLRKDGSRFFALSETMPMTSAAGTHVGFLKILRDRTRQRAADALSRQREQALALSEERYRALFEAVDDAFCIIEFFDGPHGPLSDYVHIEANPGFERQTGIPDIVGRTIRELAPSEADGWVERYGDVLRSGDPVRFERYFAAAGRHVEVSAARVGSAPRQVSVLFRDIAQRKRAEAALRASEALARENVQRVQLALAAGAIIGTWAWDLPTDRLTVDEAFARYFGLDPQLGRDGVDLAQLLESVHPDDQAGLASAIAQAIARGGAYAHQYRARRADGNYDWLEANGRVEHGPDGVPLSFPGVLIDVGERRAVIEQRDRAAADLRALNETLEQRIAERSAELMRAEAQLRQSQKMEAVGQLTGGLAHDFNNLLGGISGSLEFMQMRISQGRFTELDRYLGAAQGAARRAAALTHRLLAFSRQQTLDPRPTDVNRLVAGMEELVRRTVGPSIAVEVVAAGGLWTTLVDPPQLENALLNLCINARDAMAQGGRLTIETGNRWLDRRTAAERDLPAGQYVSLCVSDTGTGMTPEVIAKAFDPFFTTKPIGQGTGLGLSMIYGFTRQSGGQARIYSEPGQGCMICIYLPRLVGAEAVAEAVPELAALPRAEDGETVLVVDDEPTMCMLVSEVLDGLGYASIEAADAPSGLRVLQSDARIDLLVTDVGLPGGMNGRQMADAARSVRPNLKVLFITGYAENAVVGNGLLAAGMQVLTKPFAMEALASRVREMLAEPDAPS